MNPKSIEILAAHRVFFGHQSVGEDILDGVRDLTGSTPQTLVVDLPNPPNLDASGIFHRKIGKNGAPLTKIAEFERILVNDGVGYAVDVAALKLCFVDVTATKDVAALESEYVAAIERIQKACPKLTIVHCTVPVRVHNEGLRGWARNLIKGNKNNQARTRYNAWLRATYRGKQPIFDIEAAESTHPDGSREHHPFKGVDTFALCPEYSEDGGHLNANGSRVVAKAFLESIASAVTGSP